MARALGVWPKPLVGLTTKDLLRPAQRPLAEEALMALGDGVLSGYQAVRHIGEGEGARQRRGGLRLEGLGAATADLVLGPARRL